MRFPQEETISPVTENALRFGSEVAQNAMCLKQGFARMGYLKQRTVRRNRLRLS